MFNAFLVKCAKGERAKEFAALVLLLLLPCLLFWKTIMGDSTSLVANSLWDSVKILYPLKLLAAEAFRSGEFPLWNPYTFAGTPLLADIQSAPFYPLDIFFYAFPTIHTYSLTLLLYLFLGGAFMYLFMRSINISVPGSLTAAIVFMLAGYFIFNLEWRKFYATFLWFPLVLLAVEKVLGQGRVWYVLLGGLALGFSLLAGDLRVATYLLLGVLFYAFLRIIHAQSLAGRRAISGKHFGLVMALVGLGLGVGAVQLLPAFELLPISSRQYRPPYIGWGYFDPLSFPINSVFPYLFGNEALGNFSPEMPFIDVQRFPTHPRYYAGLLPPVLAVIAFLGRKDFYSKAFSYLAFASLGFLVIVASPIEGFLRSLIPGFGAFRHEDVLHLFFASEAVLAGLGVDYLLSSRIKNEPRLKKGAKAVAGSCAAGFGVLVIASIAIRIWPQWLESAFLQVARMRYPSGFLSSGEYFQGRAESLVQWLSHQVLLPGTTILVPLMVLAAGSIALLTLSHRNRISYLPWVIIGIITIDLLYADVSLLTFRSSSEIYPNGPVISTLQEESAENLFRVHSVVPDGNTLVGGEEISSITHDVLRRRRSRAGVVTPSDIAYGQSVLIPYGIYSVDGGETFYPARYVEYAAAADGVRPGEFNDFSPFYDYTSPLLDLLNVKYFLSKEKLDHPTLDLVYHGEVLAYQNSDVLPRAFWVPRARIFSDSQILMRYLNSPLFDPRQEVLLEEPFDGELGDGEPTSRSVTITRYAFNSVAVHVATNQPGFLVLTDTYYPGWKALTDGKETRLFRGNYLFRAVYVPPGNHDVEFVFQPLSFEVGFAITVLTLGLIVGLSGYRISRRFKPGDRDPSFPKP